MLWKVWPKWGWAAFIYPIGMAFAVVYPGEDYLIDIVAGWLYAAVAFWIVWGSRGWLRRRVPVPAPARPAVPATVPIEADAPPMRR